MTRTSTRAGFTLVEMLVALAIMIGLMGLAVMIFPGARDQDRVRNVVGDVTSHLKMAQAMAVRDSRGGRAPAYRGIRFLNDGSGYCTELQFIELPPGYTPNPNTLSYPTLAAGQQIGGTEPRVRFEYEVSNGTAPDRFGRTPVQPAGTVTYRRCIIENLKPEQVGQITAGSSIVMPTFGSWHKITKVPTQTHDLPPVGNPAGPNPAGRYRVEVDLEVYPDANMGASTVAVVYHFGIYAAAPGSVPVAAGSPPSGATPLIGEPTLLLPEGACIDLRQPVNPSDPTVIRSLGPTGAGDFDVIFGSDGKIVGNYGGQVVLWVHNTNKFPANIQTATGTDLANAYRVAGDQHFITIRGSGAFGRAEVVSPAPDGSWGTTTPFDIARQNAQ